MGYFILSHPVRTGAQPHNSFVLGCPVLSSLLQLATSQRAGVIWSAGRSASFATRATVTAAAAAASEDDDVYSQQSVCYI